MVSPGGQGRWQNLQMHSGYSHCDFDWGQSALAIPEEVYAVRAIKVFPLVPAIFCVLPIHRSQLRTFLASGNGNV